MTAAICHALDMGRKRSPQEKKILSYLKDGRNKYGENDKAARKAIPARKAWVNRTYRRTLRQAVCHGAADIEDNVASVRRKGWKKWADEPLASHLNYRWRIRQERGGNEPSTSTLREEALRRYNASRDSPDW